MWIIAWFLLAAFVDGQYLGSNFLGALRGYAGDTCRFISCPVGQQCVNGVCNGGALLGGGDYYGGLSGGYGYGGGLGLFGGANKLCAETVDCYSGQICQGGRCMFTSGYGGFGGYLPLTAGGMMSPALDAGAYSTTGNNAAFIDRPSGVQMCSLMQDCLNGQICVNGYCSQSNVVYGGSQTLRSLTNCGTGAVCPVAHVCVGGVCMPNYFSKSSVCLTSATCPPGMFCQVGRCLPTAFYGKKRK